MKKFFRLAFAIIFTLTAVFTSAVKVVCADSLRGYAPLVMQKGAFVKVVNQRTVSTAQADENDSVTFINPTDVWLGEAKVFPKETIFSGYIEELHEPVQGTNGSMKIKINKVIYPDNREMPIEGYITYKGDSTIGGELTAPMEYAKMPHYIYYPKVHRGVIQYTPGNKRFFGQHTVVKPGAELVLELTQNFNAIDMNDNADF